MNTQNSNNGGGSSAIINLTGRNRSQYDHSDIQNSKISHNFNDSSQLRENAPVTSAYDSAQVSRDDDEVDFGGADTRSRRVVPVT